MNFGQIKTNIGISLADAGQIHFTVPIINTALQHAYDDICSLSQCIIKKVTLDWISDLSYYDFKVDCAVADFMAVTAIFNNVNGRWLQDDLTIKQFDQLRNNWETWYGTPNWWTFSDPQRTAIVPKKQTATGNFDLYYWATAPAISDGSSPLVALDMQKLFEKYTVAELLEQSDEYIKAGLWWSEYYEELDKFRDRTKNIAKGDFRILI